MAALAATAPTQASIYTEVDDAGITPLTAQYIPVDTTTIFGNLSDNDGADVYAFMWGGGIFSANTEGSSFDTMLSIFDTSGSLLAFNDDAGDSTSSLLLELVAGSYFMGITFYPNNYMGDMKYYSDLGLDASYQITMNSVLPPQQMEMPEANVPEPATLALMGIGFAGILLIRQKRIAAVL
ncbi:MAG: DVUA0089 family protein [Nitrosospira sp.]